MESVEKLKQKYLSALKEYKNFIESITRDETDEERAARVARGERGATFTNLSEEENGEYKVMELTLETIFTRDSVVRKLEEARKAYHDALNNK